MPAKTGEGRPKGLFLRDYRLEPRIQQRLQAIHAFRRARADQPLTEDAVLATLIFEARPHPDVEVVVAHGQAPLYLCLRRPTRNILAASCGFSSESAVDIVKHVDEHIPRATPAGRAP